MSRWRRVWIVGAGVVLLAAGCGRDDSAERAQVGSLGSQLQATQGTLDVERQRTHDAEQRAAAAETRASVAEEKVSDLSAKLGAAQQQLDATTTTATTIAAAPTTTALVIRLTDDATLRLALDDACHEVAGARGQDGAYGPFAAYFHQLETQQQQLAAQGKPSYKPDPAGQAMDWTYRAGACY